MIKCKQEKCLQIEQYCIENNFSLEVSCKHYGIKKRYYTHLKTQLNLLPDGVVLNVWNIHFGKLGSLLPITDELLWHVFELCEQGIVVSSCIV